MIKVLMIGMLVGLSAACQPNSAYKNIDENLAGQIIKQPKSFEELQRLVDNKAIDGHQQVMFAKVLLEKNISLKERDKTTKNSLSPNLLVQGN